MTDKSSSLMGIKSFGEFLNFFKENPVSLITLGAGILFTVSACTAVICCIKKEPACCKLSPTKHKEQNHPLTEIKVEGGVEQQKVVEHIERESTV